MFEVLRHHRFLCSLYLFKLNAGARTQDGFGIDAKEFLDKIKRSQPYQLPMKKTTTAHFV